MPRSSSLSAAQVKCTGVPSDHVTANARQLAMSFSCSELNWSASGFVGRIFCSSQRHCATDASSSAVGVSALYSRSFGGPLPSYAKSNRPKSDSSFDRHDRATRSCHALGIASASKRLRVTMCSAASRQRACSSAAAASSASISSHVNR